MVKRSILFIAIGILAFAGIVVSLHKLLREFGPTQISITESGIKIVSWGEVISTYFIEAKPRDRDSEKPGCFYVVNILSLGIFSHFKDERSLGLEEIKELCGEKLEGVKKAEITVSVERRGHYYKETREINFDGR